MAVYKRGKYYVYEFVFRGQRIREAAHTTSKAIAEQAERKRRRELEESLYGIARREQPKLFTVAASQWLELKKPNWAGSTLRIESKNVEHLLQVFGRLLVTDVRSEHVSSYQRLRVEQGAANKTVNLEVG